MINLKVINRRNNHQIQYIDVASGMRTITRDPEQSVPEPDGHVEYICDSKHSDIVVVTGD